MSHMLLGPTWGIVLIASITGIITLACWILMFRFLLHPGEHNPDHAKYGVLRDDR